MLLACGGLTATRRQQSLLVWCLYLENELQRSRNGNHPDLHQRQNSTHCRQQRGHIHQLDAKSPEGQPGEDCMEDCQLQGALEDPSECFTEGGCCVFSGSLRHGQNAYCLLEGLLLCREQQEQHGHKQRQLHTNLNHPCMSMQNVSELYTILILLANAQKHL